VFNTSLTLLWSSAVSNTCKGLFIQNATAAWGVREGMV